MGKRKKWIFFFAEKLGYLSKTQVEELTKEGSDPETSLSEIKNISSQDLDKIRFLYVKFSLLKAAQEKGQLSEHECQQLLQSKLREFQEGESSFSLKSLEKKGLGKEFCQNTLEELRQTNKITKEDLQLAQKVLASMKEEFSLSWPERERPYDKLESPLLLEEEISKNFGIYEIIEEIGRGGMGIVYKAWDTRLERTVALKVISTEQRVGSKQISRFMREARSMAQLEHPNIIKVYDVGESPKNYFAMEYIEGEVLSRKIKSSVKMSPKKIAQILLKVALALVEVHKQGIIHRDIKPSNIMLDSRGEPRLMDFGLVKVGESDLSRSGELLGTPVYMPPEQADSKRVTAQSDIYSLGATLYEALTRTPPYQGETVFNIIHQILTRDPVAPRQLNPNIPIDLESICLKCLEKSPRKRYRDSSPLAQDLENYLQGRPISAKPATNFTRLKKWILRNKVISGSFTIIFLLISIGLLVTLQQNIKIKSVNQKLLKKKEEIAEQMNKIEEQSKALKVSEKQQRYAHKKALQKWYYADMALAQVSYWRNNAQETYSRLKAWEKDPIVSWEWYWLNSLLHREEDSLALDPKQNPGPLADCSFSPDGRFLAAVENNKLRRALLWDLTQKKFLYFIPITKYGDKKVILENCVFHPNGKYLALGGAADFSLWDLQEKRYLKKVRNRHYLTSLAYSPDGKFLACSFQKAFEEDRFLENYPPNLGYEVDQREKDLLILRDGSSGQKIKSFPCPHSVYSCSFSPNGKYLATAVEGEQIFVWEVESGKKLQGFKTKHTLIKHCQYHPLKDDILVSVGSEGKVFLWDTKTQTSIPFGRDESSILKCKFTPDGQELVTIGRDNRLILWDIPSQKILFSHLVPGEKKYNSLFSCALSPDGKTIATGSSDPEKPFPIKLWKVKKRPNPHILTKSFLEVARIVFHPVKNNIFATISEGNYLIDFWDTQTGQRFSSLNTGNFYIRECAFSPDGKYLAVAAHNSNLMLFDISAQKEVASFTTKANFRKLSYCSFSSDGKYLVASSSMRSTDQKSTIEEDCLMLWEVPSPKNFRKGIEGTELLGKYHYHKDGKFVLHNEQSKALNTGGYDLYNCHFKGNDLVVIFDHGVLVWNIKTQEYEVPLELGSGCYTLAFNSDKSLMVFGYDKALVLIETKNWKPIKVFGYHSNRIKACTFTPDGKRIISTSYERTIKIWQVDALPDKKEGETLSVSIGKYRGKELPPLPLITNSLLTLEHGKNPITAMSLSSDGKTLLVGDEKGVLKMWQLDKTAD